MNQLKLWLKANSDRIGIASSVLCLIHCIAVPFVLLSAELSIINFDTTWHYWDVVFILLALLSVYFATRKPTAKWVQYCLWMAAICFGGALALHNFFEWAHIASVTSSVLLVGFHWYNHKLKHKIYSYSLA